VPEPTRPAWVPLPVSEEVFEAADPYLRKFLSPAKLPRSAEVVFHGFMKTQKKPGFLPAPWVAPTGIHAERIREFFTLAHYCYLENQGLKDFVARRAPEIQYRTLGLDLLLQDKK
jgi:hypothetical protein